MPVRKTVLNRVEKSKPGDAGAVGRVTKEPPETAAKTDTHDPQLLVQDQQGNPIPEAHVLLIAPNKTNVEGISNPRGEVVLKQPISGELRTVFCAAAQFTALAVRSYDPRLPTTIHLAENPDGGSVIIIDGVGEVPGLKGTLNPILDTVGRTYIYAHNIAIEGGKQQPVNFARNQLLSVEDNQGDEFRLKILEIIGSSSLIEYKRVKGPTRQ
jgi:hypothetical protein